MDAGYANGEMVWPNESWHTVFDNTENPIATAFTGDEQYADTYKTLSGYDGTRPTKLTGYLKKDATSTYFPAQRFSGVEISANGATLCDYADGLTSPTTWYYMYASGRLNNGAVQVRAGAYQYKTATDRKMYQNSTLYITKIEQFY